MPPADAVSELRHNLTWQLVRESRDDVGDHSGQVLPVYRLQVSTTYEVQKAGLIIQSQQQVGDGRLPSCPTSWV